MLAKQNVNIYILGSDIFKSKRWDIRQNSSVFNYITVQFILIRPTWHTQKRLFNIGYMKTFFQLKILRAIAFAAAAAAADDDDDDDEGDFGGEDIWPGEE